MHQCHELVVEDLTVVHQRVPAVHHVSFRIGCGSCVALTGPNGAGKTSLLKAIAGLLPHETGHVYFHGKELHGIPASAFAYVPQRGEIDWDFPVTVRGVAEMGCFPQLGLWRSFGKKEQMAVEEALRVMQIEDIAERQIRALSGGQQQRAFLARALVQKAHVFLLDEPFAGLDRSSEESLVRTLRSLAANGNLIIASHHDLKTIPDYFDQTLLLNGELIAFGRTHDVFTPENISRAFDTRVFSGPHAHHHHHA